jgi:hypothetical protein
MVLLPEHLHNSLAVPLCGFFWCLFPVCPAGASIIHITWILLFLADIALKSVEEGLFIAEGEGQQHTTVVVPHETLQPLPGPQTRSQKRNADAAGMSSGVCTVPGSNADVPREAVQLSSYVLGTGLHGPVKLGRWEGKLFPCSPSIAASS